MELQTLQRNLVQVVRRASVPRFHDRVIGTAGVDLDRVEAIALSRIIDVGEMRLSDLAGQLGVACSTAGRHAAHLADRDLVTRTPDPGDARAVVVTATDEGRVMLELLREGYRSVLADALADWEAADVQRLTDLLGRLAASLTPGPPPSTHDRSLEVPA